MNLGAVIELDNVQGFLGDFDFAVKTDIELYDSLNKWITTLNKDLEDSGMDRKYEMKTQNHSGEINSAFICEI
jgi:hypothetical protein